LKSLINYAGLTDRGRRRKFNEDNWYADLDQGLFIVSDGMGGHAGGELASTMVVEQLPQLFRQRIENTANISDPNTIVGLVLTLADLNERFHETTQKNATLRGMGATLALTIIRESQALIAHLGDSRVYLLRDGNLKRLTRDHSVVQKLIDAGKIKPEEAAKHPARGQITRCMGMPGIPHPEIHIIDLVPSDRLLLCTDGLTRMLPEEHIGRVMMDNPIPYTACRVMINDANEAGGIDNIAAVLIDLH
jgi:protein phosphatase